MTATTAVKCIEVRVLLVAGELGKVDSIDALESEVLARIAWASMPTLAGIGYLSLLEAPVDVASAISEFACGLWAKPAN